MIHIISHSAIILLAHITIIDFYIYILSYRKLIFLSCDAIRIGLCYAMRLHIAYDRRNLVIVISKILRKALRVSDAITFKAKI